MPQRLSERRTRRTASSVRTALTQNVRMKRWAPVLTMMIAKLSCNTRESERIGNDTMFFQPTGVVHPMDDPRSERVKSHEESWRFRVRPCRGLHFLSLSLAFSRFLPFSYVVCSTNVVVHHSSSSPVSSSRSSPSAPSWYPLPEPPCTLPTGVSTRRSLRSLRSLGQSVF